jgi:hypothetical protein
MALTKIDGISLSTAITYVEQPKIVTQPDGTQIEVKEWVEDQSSDSYKAKAFLDGLGIRYTWLNYADPAQHVEVFPPLNSWVFEDGMHTFNEFPFLIFTKCDDTLPLDQWPKAVIMGLQNLQSSNIAELYAMGRPSGSTGGV